MERIYQVTPEMFGHSWTYLLRRAAAISTLYLAWAILFSVVLHKDRIAIMGVGGIAAELLSVVGIRFQSPSKLRITENSIEEMDGPVIRKDTIVSVNEHTDREPAGIEIIGRRNSRYLPKYRIFVPAAIHGFEEAREILLGWKAAAEQQTFFADAGISRT